MKTNVSCVSCEIVYTVIYHRVKNLVRHGKEVPLCNLQTYKWVQQIFSNNVRTTQYLLKVMTRSSNLLILCQYNEKNKYRWIYGHTQWTYLCCNDIGVTSPSISPRHCWYIVNEIHDDVNLRYPHDIRILRLDQPDF